MQFSERWLRTLVDPALSTQALAETLTMAGLEVDALEPVAPPFTGVVVAQVLEVKPHPDAQRLSVCRVDAGGGARTVVCGAPNVAAGQKVPCALPGAVLPGGVAIGKAKVRGVESEGMLCSARELGLSDDASGLLVLPGPLAVGVDLRVALALDDHLFTLKLTPNRADCFSVLGVAREVAALTGAPLSPPPCPPVPASVADTFPVRLSAPEGCARFAGRVIRGVDARAPTPAWMVERLARSGQRSVSAIVDVTNYVMIELGRPLHAYDLAKLRGLIDVRWSRRGERLTLLNGQTVELEPDLLAITDESGPIGLAGVMGGESTEVDLGTRDVFLESAFFLPEAIAGRARRLGFGSEAAHRFERGVDPANNVDGIERATALILEICGGEPGPVVDTVEPLPARAPLRLRPWRASRILGVEVPPATMAAALERLGLKVAHEGEDLIVTPPSWRFDLAIEEDLIEEVARSIGYDSIPAHPPRARQRALPQPEGARSTRALRERLVARDYQEIVTFAFVPEAWETDFAGNRAPIRLVNPIASHLGVMRSSLVGGLVGALRHNLAHRQTRVRVFEAARVFRGDPRQPAQPRRVAALAYGEALPEQWGTPSRRVDFHDVKGDLEALLAPAAVRTLATAHPALHPGRSASVHVDGQEIGFIGELHPRLALAYDLPSAPVVFEVDLDAARGARVPVASLVPKVPQLRRDIALVVDATVPARAVLDVLEGARTPIVARIALFDVYAGPSLPPGKKSFAFLILMQHTERTLTDDEADAAVRTLVAAAERDLGGTLRQ